MQLVYTVQIVCFNSLEFLHGYHFCVKFFNISDMKYVHLSTLNDFHLSISYTSC